MKSCQIENFLDNNAKATIKTCRYFMWGIITNCAVKSKLNQPADNIQQRETRKEREKSQLTQLKSTSTWLNSYTEHRPETQNTPKERNIINGLITLRTFQNKTKKNTARGIELTINLITLIFKVWSTNFNEIQLRPVRKSFRPPML